MKRVEEVIEQQIKSLAGLAEADRVTKAIVKALVLNGYTIVVNDERKDFYRRTGL